MSIDLERMNSIRWWHRIRLSPDVITPGVVNHGPDDGSWPTTRFGMPERLDGLSVLDVGAYDGFFSFEAERRGASVVAIDIRKSDGFAFAHDALGSKVHFEECGIHDAPRLGKFDLVLCYGVLYHLKDPLGGIEALAKVTAGDLLLETAYAQGEGVLMEYRPGWDRDPTNYWYPTASCIASMLAMNHFPSEIVYRNSHRLTMRARSFN